MGMTYFTSYQPPTRSRLTPAEKAHHTKVRNATIRIEQVMGTVTDFDDALAKIPAAFLAEPVSVRTDAFWVLDNDHRTAGHGWLRSIRNHSEHGPALFRTFLKENQK